MTTPSQAAAFFAARLDFQTDVSDVQAALAKPDPGLILIDSRSPAAWDQGHIPGALHLPTAEIALRARDLLDPAVPVVTYCWGPGCNGATRAALALALAGYDVKEMIGGVEYWIREGFPLRTQEGDVTAEPDQLTAPAEAKPAEGKPAEAKPAEAKPAKAKPAEAKPAEAKPAEAKPAEAEEKAGEAACGC
jgi:rhodanese-related sulfurtransferase